MWERITGFVAGAALAFALTVSFYPASADSAVISGAGDAGAVEEQLRWQTAKGNLQRATVQRTLVRVPEDWGDVVTASGANETTWLWFKDKNGTMRNVIVRQPGALVQVEKVKAQ